MKNHAEAGSLKVEEVKYLLEGLKRDVPWALSNHYYTSLPDFQNLKAEFQESLANIPGLLKKLSHLEPKLSQAESDLIHRLVALNQGIQVAKMMDLMGENRFDSYNKALGKTGRVIDKME